MLEVVESPSLREAAWADAIRVGRKIPPLWGLSGYVAVNPFLGFAGVPIVEAAREVGDGLGARVLPAVADYRRRRESGDFDAGDLARAAGRRGLDPAWIEAVLAGEAEAPSRPRYALRTLAEEHDLRHGGGWEDLAVRQIARWCAVYASKGGPRWQLPRVEGQGLYASWREAATADRSPEILGLRGFRRRVAALPRRADEALTEVLGRPGSAPVDREAYLYRLLGNVYGWASFLRRDSWGAGDGDPIGVAELLAIRASFDALVADLAPRPSPRGSGRALPRGVDRVEDEATRLVFQDAWEDGFARKLLGRLAVPAKAARPPRPAVQAVFCIDVRSEPLRRHLEAQSRTIQTRGLAGFFGVPLDWQGSARCPVLLEPTIAVRCAGGSSSGVVGAISKHLQAAPAVAFNLVEWLGMGYGLRLAADALALRGPRRSAEETVPFGLEAGFEGEARARVAAGIVKNAGLRGGMARLVLLCGHSGRSSNNPHAAGLDCGACGGHGGAINARVAAALLNDPEVRERSKGHDWEFPDDTRFVAGVHDTSVDVVTLLDADRVPPSHAADLDGLRSWLARAGALTRAERASALGLPDRPEGAPARLFRRRSRDWSEVRPEWGLARNAAFIAARRDRTRGVDLEGRAFLHDYDATLDPDGTTLGAILSAPMVVASWINLQYFASTVDNRAFGAGTKALHNRVGSLGVVLGNGGDLRTGLPLQSVHDAQGRWFHEPLRLQVVVEASRSRIDQALSASEAARGLADNGWVRLFSLDPDGPEASLRLRGGGWEVVRGRSQWPGPRALHADAVSILGDRRGEPQAWDLHP